MFVLQVKEMFLQKGVLRPYFQLLKMGIPRIRAQKILNGTQKTIDLADLYKFCTYLNCTPKELLAIELPKDSTSLDNTPLKEWVKQTEMNLIKELIEMTPNELQRMKEFVKELRKEDNI